MLPLWWRRPGESLPLEPSKGRDKSNKAINEISWKVHTIRWRPWLWPFSPSQVDTPSLNSVLFNIVSSGQKYLLWKFREHSLTAIHILLYVRLCEWAWAGEWWVARRLKSREGWLQLHPTPVLTHTHLVTGDMSRATCQGVSRGAASRHPSHLFKLSIINQ